MDLYACLVSIAIFSARVCDVSLGTIRTIMVFRGRRFLASAIGFLEVLIWVAASAKVLTNLNQWYLVLAYCAGYATGNATGIWLESKLAVGMMLVTAVSAAREINLTRVLRDNGYAVTHVEGTGPRNSPVEIALIPERRREAQELLHLIKATDPDAIYTVEDIRQVYNGSLKIRGGKHFRWHIWSKRK